MMKTFIGMDYQRGLNMLKDLIETDRFLSNQSSRSRVGATFQDGWRRRVEQCRQCWTGHGSVVCCPAQAAFKSLGIPMTGDMISVYNKFSR